MIIPSEYYMEDIEIKLTQQDIDLIIDELERTEYNIFVFLRYEDIIKKLRGQNVPCR
jgi:hypothetical protein